MLGGGRALLMQGRSSARRGGRPCTFDYERNPAAAGANDDGALLDRARTRAEADRVAAHVHAVHAHVCGRHGDRRYTAFDPI